MLHSPPFYNIYVQCFTLQVLSSEINWKYGSGLHEGIGGQFQTIYVWQQRQSDPIRTAAYSDIYTRLSEYGLRCVEITKDDNCFFMSIATILSRSHDLGQCICFEIEALSQDTVTLSRYLWWAIEWSLWLPGLSCQRGSNKLGGWSLKNLKLLVTLIALWVISCHMSCRMHST